MEHTQCFALAPEGGSKAWKGNKVKQQEEVELLGKKKMAQGAQKFKAQRAGAAKKQHQNKQKGPKKGGRVRGDDSLLHESHGEESEPF